MTGLDELKKYLKPSYLYLYASAGFMLIGLFGAAASGNVLILLFLGGVAVLNSLSTIKEINNLSETIKRFTDNGSIERIIEEFKQARSFAGGNLRLGHTHIFGKKSAAILEYKDIAKAYQYIHKTNFAEDRRELRVETQDGKVFSLCKLELRGKADTSVMTILKEMLSQNPGIKIGYK